MFGLFAWCLGAAFVLLPNLFWFQERGHCLFMGYFCHELASELLIVYTLCWSTGWICITVWWWMFQISGWQWRWRRPRAQWRLWVSTTWPALLTAPPRVSWITPLHFEGINISSVSELPVAGCLSVYHPHMHASVTRTPLCVSIVVLSCSCCWRMPFFQMEHTFMDSELLYYTVHE